MTEQDVRTFEWNRHRREIGSPDKSDFQIACRVRMLMRNQLDHEAVCTDARDRIMCLSEEKASLSTHLDEIRAAVEPVHHWYQSDEEHERPFKDILADIVADLQTDRADSLRLTKELREAQAEIERLREAPLDRDALARIITLDHLQLLHDFDVDGDLYRLDPECADAAYATADAILALTPSGAQGKANPEAEADDGWQWWAGFNDEWMTIGPCPTRESAIDEAVQDGSGEFLDENEDPPVWKNAIYITEARQDPLRLADWIGLNWLLERAEEQLADSDRVACENDDGPWFEVTPEQDKDLQERIRRTCDQWQADHALVFTTATFSHQRNSDHLTVPALRDGAGEADNG